jgi:hypothetical protein
LRPRRRRRRSEGLLGLTRATLLSRGKERNNGDNTKATDGEG